MKILYFTSNTLPSKRANHTQVLKMCEALSHFTKVVLTLNEARGDFKQKYNIKKDFEIIELKYNGRLRSFVYTWKLKKLLKDINPDFLFIRDNYLLFAYNFFKKLRLIKETPEIITEIQGVYALNFLSRKIANFNSKFLRIKFLEKLNLKNFFSKFLDRVHGAVALNFISRQFDRFNLDKVDFFIFFTQYLKDYYLKNYKINPQKTIVLPNGIDLDLFDISLTKKEIRKKVNLPLDKKIIGWVGNFKEQRIDKGLMNIFKAAKKLDNPDYLFLIIGGDKKDIEEYRTITQDLGIGDYIKFTGFVDFDNVPLYLKSLDLALMPFSWTTHYAYHMCPRKLFDYLAAGLPLISSDLPSLRSILNEKNCVFCKPGDANDLAEKLDYLLASPEIRNKIITQAEEDIKEYTWQKRAKKILEFIDAQKQ